MALSVFQNFVVFFTPKISNNRFFRKIDHENQNFHNFQQSDDTYVIQQLSCTILPNFKSIAQFLIPNGLILTPKSYQIKSSLFKMRFLKLLEVGRKKTNDIVRFSEQNWS